MVELEIIDIIDNNYLLFDKENKRKYDFDLYFYGLGFDVEVGDKIVLNDNLLNENYLEYSEEYYFGPIDEVYGRKINSMNDIDLITIKKGNKNIYLKRFYG